MSNIVRMPCPPPCPPPSNPYPGWVWNGCEWVCCDPPHPAHPIWPPQPCPPPMPDCGPPSCFSAVAKANACWDQSQMLEDLIKKVLIDVIEDNPGIIPVPPPAPGTGPIIGVTDGSDAAPGEVGEFIASSTTVNFPSTPNNAVVSAAVLQPGDWDCYAGFLPNAWLAGCVIGLSPVPAGVSNAMPAQSGDATTSSTATIITESDAIVNCATARASVTVPTLMAFQIGTNFLLPAAAAPQAGSGTFRFAARRRR